MRQDRRLAEGTIGIRLELPGRHAMPVALTRLSPGPPAQEMTPAALNAASSFLEWPSHFPKTCALLAADVADGSKTAKGDVRVESALPSMSRQVSCGRQVDDELELGSQRPP